MSLAAQLSANLISTHNAPRYVFSYTKRNVIPGDYQASQGFVGDSWGVYVWAPQWEKRLRDSPRNVQTLQLNEWFHEYCHQAYEWPPVIAIVSAAWTAKEGRGTFSQNDLIFWISIKSSNDLYASSSFFYVFEELKHCIEVWLDFRFIHVKLA